MKSTEKNNFIKYYNVGFQITGIILVGIFLGYQLDSYLGWLNFPITISISIILIISLLYRFVMYFGGKKKTN